MCVIEIKLWNTFPGEVGKCVAILNCGTRSRECGRSKKNKEYRRVIGMLKFISVKQRNTCSAKWKVQRKNY